MLKDYGITKSVIADEVNFAFITLRALGEKLYKEQYSSIDSLEITGLKENFINAFLVEVLEKLKEECPKDE